MTPEVSRYVVGDMGDVYPEWSRAREVEERDRLRRLAERVEAVEEDE